MRVDPQYAQANQTDSAQGIQIIAPQESNLTWWEQHRSGFVYP